MPNANLADQPIPDSDPTPRLPRIAGVIACVLFGAVLALGVRMLWDLDKMPVANNMKEQMMHRKTRTMEQILDGLVRGNLSGVEDSGERMWEIGTTLNWYLSNPLYADNDEVFRDSTASLIQAAGEGDFSSAKESALRLERSCIECHALINREKNPNP